MCFILFSAFLGRDLGSYDARGVRTTEPHDPEHVLSEDVTGTICPCFGPQQDSKSQSPGGQKAGVLRCLAWPGRSLRGWSCESHLPTTPGHQWTPTSS